MSSVSLFYKAVCKVSESCDISAAAILALRVIVKTAIYQRKVHAERKKHTSISHPLGRVQKLVHSFEYSRLLRSPVGRSTSLDDSAAHKYRSDTQRINKRTTGVRCDLEHTKRTVLCWYIVGVNSCLLVQARPI